MSAPVYPAHAAPLTTSRDLRGVPTSRAEFALYDGEFYVVPRPGTRRIRRYTTYYAAPKGAASSEAYYTYISIRSIST